MTKLIIDISKYILLILIAIYTFQSYSVFKKKDEDAKEFLFLRQNALMFAIHFVAFVVFYLRMEEPTLFYFYGAQAIYLAAVLVLFRNLYPKASKLLINNMCMLITVGFIMLTRISYDQSIRQFKILAVATVVALLVPIIIRKFRFLSKWTYVYAVLGLGLLGVVAVLGNETYGAKMQLDIGAFSFQPSEFVKIIFVFCVAGMLAKSTSFLQVVKATAIAALHVLILVASTDLGSALIFFLTYLLMLYVATRDWRYLAAGLLAGALAAVVAYFLFSHVHRALPGFSHSDPHCGAGLHVLCHRRGAGRSVRHVRHPDLHELLHHDRQYRHEDGKDLLQADCPGTWLHLCRPGMSHGGRRDEDDPHDRRYLPADQLWRKLYHEHRADVCHRAGLLYLKEGETSPDALLRRLSPIS